MKTLFAILFSVMLVWGQTVSAVGLDSSTAVEDSGDCSCAVQCCMASTPVMPQPRPAANPVQTELRQQVLVAVTLVSALIEDKSSFGSDSVFPPVSMVKPAAVPLYDWNCSYLI